MSVPEARRLNELETKIAQLKKRLAETVLESEVTKEALAESGSRTSQARIGTAGAVDEALRATSPQIGGDDASVRYDARADGNEPLREQLSVWHTGIVDMVIT